MGTYTFICEHAGGTYISQFIANDMMTAFSQWVSYFCCSQYVNNEEREIIKWWSTQSDMPPCAIDEVTNVWFWEVRIKKRYLILHIIKTEINSPKAF